MSLLRQIDKIETFRQSVGCATVNWPLHTSGRGKLKNWSQCLQTSLRISYFAGIHLSNFSIFFLLVIVSCWSFCISISFSICSTWFFSLKHEIFGRIFLIFFLPYLLYVIVWFLADRKGLLLDNHHQRKHLFELFSLFRVFSQFTSNCGGHQVKCKHIWNRKLWPDSLEAGILVDLAKSLFTCELLTYSITLSFTNRRIHFKNILPKTNSACFCSREIESH